MDRCWYSNITSGTYVDIETTAYSQFNRNTLTIFADLNGWQNSGHVYLFGRKSWTRQHFKLQIEQGQIVLCTRGSSIVADMIGCEEYDGHVVVEETRIRFATQISHNTRACLPFIYMTTLREGPIEDSGKFLYSWYL